MQSAACLSLLSSVFWTVEMLDAKSMISYKVVVHTGVGGENMEVFWWKLQWKKKNVQMQCCYIHILHS